MRVEAVRRAMAKWYVADLDGNDVEGPFSRRAQCQRRVDELNGDVGKKRKCMRCEISFYSTHKFNRLCHTCKRRYG